MPSHSNLRLALATSALVLALVLAAAFVLNSAIPGPDTAQGPARALTFDAGQLAELPVEGDFPRPVARPVSLQRDLAPHRDVRTEAWRVSGLLNGAAGEPLVLDVTIARFGLVPGAVADASESRWQARGGWGSAVSLVAPGKERRHAAQRVARDAALVSAGDDSALTLPGLSLQPRADGVTLSSDDDASRLVLSFTLAKPPLVALDGSSAAPLRAFSLTRLAVRGKLVDVETGRVEALGGVAWLDRAWGELPLPGAASVTERYAVQLEDGRELIVNRSWRRGSTRRRASAQLVAVNGRSEALGGLVVGEVDGGLSIEANGGALSGTLVMKKRDIGIAAPGGGEVVSVKFSGVLDAEAASGRGFGQRAPP